MDMDSVAVAVDNMGLAVVVVIVEKKSRFSAHSHK